MIKRLKNTLPWLLLGVKLLVTITSIAATYFVVGVAVIVALVIVDVDPHSPLGIAILIGVLTYLVIDKLELSINTNGEPKSNGSEEGS